MKVRAAPTPTDGRASKVAAALIDNPADPRNLDQWGRRVGASGRTLARAFANETGISFARWRTSVRLRAALPHLAAGDSEGLAAGRLRHAKRVRRGLPPRNRTDTRRLFPHRPKRTARVQDAALVAVL